MMSARPGSLSVPLRVEGIYCGERCSRAIQTVIVKALHDAHPQLTFYRVRFDANTFELHRQEVDIDEEIHCGICPPVALSFRAVLKPVLPSGAIQLPAPETEEIGRASCRERVCQYVLISGVAVSLKKKQIIYKTKL